MFPCPVFIERGTVIKVNMILFVRPPSFIDSVYSFWSSATANFALQFAGG
jgi:hypothetical protein